MLLSHLAWPTVICEDISLLWTRSRSIYFFSQWLLLIGKSITQVPYATAHTPDAETSVYKSLWAAYRDIANAIDNARWYDLPAPRSIFTHYVGVMSITRQISEARTYLATYKNDTVSRRKQSNSSSRPESDFGFSCSVRVQIVVRNID